MKQTSNSWYYFYDSKYDDLLIKLNENSSVYSDEVYNNIYIIKSEEDDSIVGTQILYFKKRSDKILKKYLPDFIYNAVMNLDI